MDDVSDKQGITAWVFQIARNLVIDHYLSEGWDLAAPMPDDVKAPTHKEENLNE